MEFERPQAGNPRGLTIREHIFPVSGISRFVNRDGRVSVLILKAGNRASLAPDDQLFCARRVWDQRAEAGYMKQIEDDFQALADRIVGGLSNLDNGASGIISKFFALWSLRLQTNCNPYDDRVLNGVVEESLSKDQQEGLEKQWVLFVRGGGKMPGRMVAGLQIQVRIDEIVNQFQGLRWGVVRASGGEFIVPDTFGQLTIVPVASAICLVCNHEDVTVSKSGVSRINQMARSSAQKYLFARDMDQCP